MNLTSKTIFSNNSIVVIIPSQLGKAYNITAGDTLEFTPIKEENRIRKMNILQTQKDIK
jgi:hypothetical protein